MISSNDFRPGVTIELNGDPCQVIEFQHVKPGKGAAFVRTKVKNLKTGSTTEMTFRGGEKVPRAVLERHNMNYLYQDGDSYVFMDNQTYDQLMLTSDQLAEGKSYLKDGMEVQVMLYQGKVLGVELPTSVELEVIETEPGIKGDTASGGSKPATMETGIIVNVPFFVNIGDVLRIDTRTGAYMERA